jgi:transcriptional regulator with XRE-family HTH domain
MHGSSMLPNRKLQQARLSRHWSQQKLADELDTDQQTVARWEGGKSRPGPYFRRRLCEVFALTEEALGLSGTEDVAARSSSTSDQEGIIDPFIPSPSSKLVGRDELLNKLKRRLFSKHTVTLSALVGLPGVGKTTLATALANDTAVRSRFPDGILWAALGTHPNIFAHFIRWGALLGINGEHFSSREEWSIALRMAIRDRSFLLIIDDIWKAEEALALKVGGPRCVYVLTTRRVDIALQVASQNEVTKVHELGLKESMAILEHVAPEATKNEKQALRELVHLLGGLPLALMLMGKYLENQSNSGNPRRIHAAIERLRDVETRLSLSAPRSLSGQNQNVSLEKPVSLQTVIAVSDEQVSEQACGERAECPFSTQAEASLF